jgi:hypothetical protein
MQLPLQDLRETSQPFKCLVRRAAVQGHHDAFSLLDSGSRLHRDVQTVKLLRGGFQLLDKDAHALGCGAAVASCLGGRPTGAPT